MYTGENAFPEAADSLAQCPGLAGSPLPLTSTWRKLFQAETLGALIALAQAKDLTVSRYSAAELNQLPWGF